MTGKWEKWIVKDEVKCTEGIDIIGSSVMWDFFLTVFCLDGMQNWVMCIICCGHYHMLPYVTPTFTLSITGVFLCHTLNGEKSYQFFFLISVNHFTMNNTLVCESSENITISHWFFFSKLSACKQHCHKCADNRKSDAQGCN